MTLAEFLAQKRVERGFQTHEKLSAASAKIKPDSSGFWDMRKQGEREVSREAIRQFELGKKIPSKSMRALLSSLLNLDNENKEKMEYLAACAEIRKKYKELPILVLDDVVVESLLLHIGDTVETVLLGGDVGSRKVEDIKRKVVERCKICLQIRPSSTIMPGFPSID